MRAHTRRVRSPTIRHLDGPRAASRIGAQVALARPSLAVGVAPRTPRSPPLGRAVGPAASIPGGWSAGRGAKWGFIVGALALDAAVVASGSSSPNDLILIGTTGGVVGGGVGAIAGALAGRRRHPIASLASDSTLAVTRGSSDGALAPGRRIRISASALQLSRQPATVSSIAGDTVVVHADGQPIPVAVPLAAISRLEVSGGPGSRLEKVLLYGSLGALGGALALGGAGFVSEQSSCRSGSDVCGLATAAGIIVGGGLGLVIGATAGASRPTERWEEVPLHMRVAIVHVDHGIAVRLAAAF